MTGLEGVGVYDAFVEDESVAFGACDDSEVFGGGLPPKEIGVDDVNVSLFVERLGDLIDQVLTHDVIVELMGSTNVQGEPSESSVTGGEGGHEDVDTSVIGLILFKVGVDNFECVVVGESDLTCVIEGIRY